MNPVNERIKQVRAIIKISQREFAKKIYISQGSFGEIETGVRNVNDRVIQLICAEFNVNKDWLKTGNGEMFNIEKPDIRLEHLIEIYKKLNQPLQDYLVDQTELLLKAYNESMTKKK